MGHYQDSYDAELEADHQEAMIRFKKLYKQANKHLESLDTIIDEFGLDEYQQAQLENKTREIRALLYFMMRDE